jgi:uncharacterized protein (DUF433 family)
MSDRIEITPGVCGGKPRIAGHRIRVQDVVVWHEQMKMTAEEIARTYPTISLADVDAALAYYRDHRAEIHRQMTEEAAFIEELRARNPSKLKQVLDERRAQGKLKHGGGDPLPPR